jgi:NADPH-dependent 2,4-dienoyl-CoA reductase/sulfur reductase-like enzyme
LPGITRPNDAFEIVFAGRRLQAYPGESIAAAMIAAGEYVFRDSDGESRGLFCGMGVCGECQVLVDGRSRRACLEKAMPGMCVEPQPSLRPAPAGDAAARERSWDDLETDVLVVGGGPAGMSAALVAASSGLSVVLVDERQQPGGQYFKHPPASFRFDEVRIDRQFQDGVKLAREVLQSSIDYRSGVTVAGAFAGRRVAIVGEDGSTMIRARRVIVATGAYERPLPVPGWTLPGVMTTGAAQTLLRGYQVLPGQRVLIAGNGPLNLQVADELSRAGAEIVAVAELAAAPWRRPLAAASLFARGPSLALTGLRHVAALARRAVPLHYSKVLHSVSGEAGVEHATLASVDATGRVLDRSKLGFDVDAVCVNYGFQPQSELARALGCTYRPDAASGNLRCDRGIDGRSNVPEIFVVGDAGGLGGAHLALAQGRLAGASVAADLEAPKLPVAEEYRRLEREIRRHRGFQDSLWALYAAPRLTTELADDATIICRCESLDLATVSRAAGAGAASLASVKKLTRAGMGRCQGRYCSDSLTAILGTHPAMPDADFFAPRPPLKPVPVGWLAGSTGDAPVAQELSAKLGKAAPEA